MTEPRSRRNFLTTAGRTVAMVFRVAPGLVIGITLCALVEALAPLFMAFVAKQIIDQVLLAPSARSVVLGLPGPWFWVLMECVAVVVRLTAQQCNRYARTVLHPLVGMQVGSIILEKASRVAYRHFMDPAFANHLQRAREQAGVRPIETMFHIVEWFQAMVTVAGCAALLLTLSPWTLLILAVGAVPLYLLETWWGLSIFKLDEAHSDRYRKTWYIEWALTSAQTVRDLRALAASRWLIGRRIHLLGEFVIKMGRRARVQLGAATGVDVLLTLLFYSIYAYAVATALAGKASIGTMTMYVAICRQAQQALGAAVTAVARIYEHHLFMSIFFSFLARDEDDGVEAIVPAAVIERPPRLEVRGVRFTYPGAERETLKGVDLAIEPGEAVAFVGVNGGGKTTLVRLLSGLYEPSAGHILMDGIDIATRSKAWLRQNIGVVFQDAMQLTFPAAENIGMGWMPDIERRDAIERAVERAGARELIAGLPAGLDSALGPPYGESDLSTGQWQAVKLSRLLMRKSSLLVLDEPTAALDAGAEAEFFARFSEWRAGKTVILVTHRLSTIILVDRVALLDAGRIAEFGTHAELMALQGKYAKMFHLQRHGYSFGDKAAAG